MSNEVLLLLSSPFLPPLSSHVRKLCRLVLGGRVRRRTGEGEARGARPCSCSSPYTHPAVCQEGQEQRAGGTTQEAQEHPASPSTSPTFTGKPQERLRSAQIRFVWVLSISVIKKNIALTPKKHVKINKIQLNRDTCEKTLVYMCVHPRREKQHSHHGQFKLSGPMSTLEGEAQSVSVHVYPSRQSLLVKLQEMHTDENTHNINKIVFTNSEFPI